MLRRIPLGTMMNLRDLGGYPTADGHSTVWERFFRGDQPNGLTDGDIAWLLERDVTTVIDLRSLPELEHKPDPLAQVAGITYHHIPLLGGDVLPALEADVGQGYFEILNRKTSVCQVLRCIAQAPGGVLFHCSAGKDRTGLTAMLLLSLAGVSREDILADYEVSETYLAEFIRQLRAQYTDLLAFAGRSKREYMELCLDLVNEAYGDACAYLRAIDLTQAELDAIRTKLIV